MFNNDFVQRMRLWKETMLASLGKRWWFLPASLALSIVIGLMKDRVYAALNRYIDEHVVSSVRPLVLFVLSGGFWKSVLVGLALALVIFLGLAIHAYFASARAATAHTKEKTPVPLATRARELAKELNEFVNSHCDSQGHPDVYKINFLYAAHYRDKVDKMLNELAAEQIFDVCEDWVINPQTQSAKNIRLNIVDRLNSLADRLDAKNAVKARPLSKNVGTRDWPGEWLDSERRFRQLEQSGVFAQLFSGQWAIRRDRLDSNPSPRDEMEAACELAGGRLANSPGIAMSDAVRDQTEHWKRWLEFVRQVEGLNRTFDNSDDGYIEGLASVSARLCTKCAGKAHDS